MDRRKFVAAASLAARNRPRDIRPDILLVSNTGFENKLEKINVK